MVVSCKVCKMWWEWKYNNKPKSILVRTHKTSNFKANRTKGFLQHNLHNCTPTIKDRLYKAMVKPILEYAAIVYWERYERTQQQAARFVTSNYSHASITQMLIDPNWPTTARCRSEQKAIMMFKIINQLVDIPANPFLTPISTKHNTRAHNVRFTQPVTIDSSFPLAIKIWNNLPQDIPQEDLIYLAMPG